MKSPFDHEKSVRNMSALQTRQGRLSQEDDASEPLHGPRTCPARFCSLCLSFPISISFFSFSSCFGDLFVGEFSLACLQRLLPGDLQGRIRNYYYHLWQRKGAFESPELLRDLPSNMRQQVHACTYVSLEQVNNVSGSE
jgi:hypothetical protein